MLPRLTIHDLQDIALGNPVLYGERCQCPRCSIPRSYLPNLLLRKLCEGCALASAYGLRAEFGMMGWPLRPTPFGEHVSVVVCLSPPKEVFTSYARRIITTMKHVHSRGNAPTLDFVAYPVCKKELSATLATNDAVPVVISVSRPFPARPQLRAVRLNRPVLVDLRPEAFRWRTGFPALIGASPATEVRATNSDIAGFQGKRYATDRTNTPYSTGNLESGTVPVEVLPRVTPLTKPRESLPAAAGARDKLRLHRKSPLSLPLPERLPRCRGSSIIPRGHPFS